VINFGWDENGHARKTGIPGIDKVLGAGDLQDAQNCNYPPSGVIAETDVDESSSTSMDQYSTGRITLKSGAILERGRSWVSVWACTRLPDSHRDPCNQSCRCCQTGSGGYCEGQSTCPEHCPLSADVARQLGMLAEHPRAARPSGAGQPGAVVPGKIYRVGPVQGGGREEEDHDVLWPVVLLEQITSKVGEVYAAVGTIRGVEAHYAGSSTPISETTVRARLAELGIVEHPDRRLRKGVSMWNLEFEARDRDQAAAIVAAALGPRAYLYPPTEAGRLGWAVVGGFEELDLVRREADARGITSIVTRC
jgi:hypothetical protein